MPIAHLLSPWLLCFLRDYSDTLRVILVFLFDIRQIFWYNERSYAPVAQLDRAIASDAMCRRFDSGRVYQKNPLTFTKVRGFFNEAFLRNITLSATMKSLTLMKLPSAMKCCFATFSRTLRFIFAKQILHLTTSLIMCDF